jgi:hypothetical protein
MSRRLVGLCLLAYPREVRARDGEHLRDLALELADDHGVLHEAFGLFRGGLRERWRLARPRRRAVFAVTGAAVALAVLSWPAVGGPLRVEDEVEVVSCVPGPCGSS